MRTLFLHGAGGFAEDRPLADALGAALGADVEMPCLPEGDMSYEAQAAPIRAALSSFGAGDVLVAHSFGASILVRVLAERAWPVPAATLLAMPFWGPAGWDVDSYMLPPASPPQSLTLHHCADDDVVPFSHLELNAAALPSARVVSHPRGGHQFDAIAPTIAANLS